MPTIGWIDALRSYNAGMPSWCVPRKGTPGYDMVMKIRRGEPTETPKELMDKLERKTAGRPKKVVRKVRISLEEPAQSVEIPTIGAKTDRSAGKSSESIHKTMAVTPATYVAEGGSPKKEAEAVDRKALEAKRLTKIRSLAEEAKEESKKLQAVVEAKKVALKELEDGKKSKTAIAQAKKAVKEAELAVEKQGHMTRGYGYGTPKYAGSKPKTAIVNPDNLYSLGRKEAEDGTEEEVIYELVDGQMLTRFFKRYNTAQAYANGTVRVFEDVKVKDAKIKRKVEEAFPEDPKAHYYYVAKSGGPGGQYERFKKYHLDEDEKHWLATGNQVVPTAEAKEEAKPEAKEETREQLMAEFHKLGDELRVMRDAKKTRSKAYKELEERKSRIGAELGGIYAVSGPSRIRSSVAEREAKA